MRYVVECFTEILKGKEMMDKKNGLDKTSILMIVIFVVIVAGAVAGVILWKSPDKNEIPEEPVMIDSKEVQEHKNDEGLLTLEDIMTIVPNAEPGSAYTYFDDNGEMQTIVIPEDYKPEKTKTPSKYKFEKFEDLSDKFFEVCKSGDVDELYNLYYDGLLEGMRLNMQEVPDKETFDRGLRENMLAVTGFEEYEYGSVELPPTQSPGSYASYIYGMVNNGKTLPFSPSQVENCVNLLVYIDNMYQTNHFMVQIDGLWYLIV